MPDPQTPAKVPASSVEDLQVATLVPMLSAALRGEAEVARQRDMDVLARQRAAEDKERMKAGKTTLVAVTAFTIMDDANPNGRVVQAGEEFEISLFDLHKYSGKGLPRAVDPLTGGVTISQA